MRVALGPSFTMDRARRMHGSTSADHHVHTCVQPVERGLDRAFRLLREDQVATMRDRLTVVDGNSCSRASKPPHFQNACFTQVGVWKQGERPYLHLEFDLPPRAFFQHKENLVRLSMLRIL